MASPLSSSDQPPLHDDDLLLYGDLSDTKPAAVAKSLSSLTPNNPTRSFLHPPTGRESDGIHGEELQVLQKQVDDLSEENRRLRRNIGTLYRTAKAEIKRKDDEISRLVHEVEILKKKL